MIYNCTSECSYPTDLFNGNVRRVAIDDHNVPTLDALLSFCRELEMTKQSRPETVFALHCKGGKVCARHGNTLSSTPLTSTAHSPRGELA